MQISSWPSWHKGMSYLISLNSMHLENILGLTEICRTLYAFSMQLMQKYCLILFCSLNTESELWMHINRIAPNLKFFEKWLLRIYTRPWLTLELLTELKIIVVAPQYLAININVKRVEDSTSNAVMHQYRQITIAFTSLMRKMRHSSPVQSS